MTAPSGADGARVAAARSSQHIALPLGNLAPVHAATPRWLTLWRRHSPRLLTVTGVAAATLAIVLTLNRGPFTVGRVGSVIRFGDAVLTLQSVSPVAGYRLYTGDAVMLVSTTQPVRATAAAEIAGRDAYGSCTLVLRPLPTENCSFELAGASLRAHDAFDAAARLWHRAYSDGVTTVLAVPPGSAVVPIPLPLGR